MKIYKTMQNNGAVMLFLDQNFRIKKNGEQLKHRNKFCGFTVPY